MAREHGESGVWGERPMSHALLGRLSLELALADTGTGVLKEGAQKQAGRHQTCGQESP